jgi:RNA polymerase sigma-70 factor, ECF subfamily
MHREPAENRFRQLFARHYGDLHAYAARRLSDTPEADDVVAETFLLLWRRLDDLSLDDEEIRLWLYGVARNMLANHVRGRLRRDRLSLQLLHEAGVAPGADERIAMSGEVRDLVEAFGQLSDGDREILLLAAWECLSSREIGVVLGCSENAAAIRLHRARQRLTAVYTRDSTRGAEARETPVLTKRMDFKR